MTSSLGFVEQSPTVSPLCPFLCTYSDVPPSVLDDPRVLAPPHLVYHSRLVNRRLGLIYRL